MPRLQRLKELNERRMNLALRAAAWNQLSGMSAAEDKSVAAVVEEGNAHLALNEWSEAERDFVLCLRECTREELQELVGARDANT